MDNYMKMVQLGFVGYSKLYYEGMNIFWGMSKVLWILVNYECHIRNKSLGILILNYL